MGVKIITDSTSYIAQDIRKELNIDIVSLNIILNNKSYREVELENEFFYKELDRSDEIPTSSQPSIEELHLAFKQACDNGDAVIGIFLSSQMSGTFSSANLVREMVLEENENAEIYIVDSCTNCMQMGYAAVAGARAAKEGKNVKEIYELMNNFIKRSRFIFSPQTLKYLKKGGRIGGASALFGSLLQIKPILTVENGITSVLTKVRTKKKAVDFMVDTMVKDFEQFGEGEITVHHINCEEEGKDLARRIEEKLGVKPNIQSIGPIIGLHVGPGSIGLAYYTKNDRK